MEPSPGVQVVRGHTATLLMSLNLQRQQAQFCDCVVRQSQSPGQLYPAHRCVLAASSPVLASLLSSHGALLELQAPCLSNSVLAILLDYIYTGALPYARTQQYYSSLLTTACYLQMDELQEALRAWRLSDADTPVSTGTDNQPLQSTASSRETEAHRYSATVEICDEAEMQPAGMDFCRGTGACEASRTTGANSCVSQDVSACCSLVSDECKVAKEAQKHQFSSSSAEKPVHLQKSTDQEFTIGDRKCSSASYPSSPHRRCGAVPVICHSSRAAKLQLTVSTVTPNHWESKASVSSCGIPPSAGTGNNNADDGISAKVKNHRSYNPNHYNPITEQAHMLAQDHNSCSTDYLMTENNKHVFTYYPRVDFKHPDRSDIHDVSMSDAGEKPSLDQRAVNLLPVEEFNTGSDCCCEDSCPKGEATEEHSYSSRCPVETDRQDFPCDLYEPKKASYPKVHRSETSTADNRDTMDKSYSHIVTTTQESSLNDVTNSPFVSERCTSLHVEQPLTFPVPMDTNRSDSISSVMGQSYHGHLHYHCLRQVDAHAVHTQSEHQQSHLDDSDQSSDEDGAGTFTSTGRRSLTQQLATGMTDQVLLLDISAKPAELLVSYKHRSDDEETAVALENYTFGTGIRSDGADQRNGATSVPGAHEQINRTMAKLGADGFDEDKTRPWVGESSEDRKRFGEDGDVPAADIMHKSGFVEDASNPETVCSSPNVPDTVQDPMSSTLSACIASNLSASMPRNISARLSTPLHPFQCSLCERSFSQRGSLNRHVRSHLGVRPFSCPCCPMTFSRQYRVTEHMRVHQRCAQGNDFHKTRASSI